MSKQYGLSLRKFAFGIIKNLTMSVLVKMSNKIIIESYVRGT